MQNVRYVLFIFPKVLVPLLSGSAAYIWLVIWKKRMGNAIREYIFEIYCRLIIITQHSPDNIETIRKQLHIFQCPPSTSTHYNNVKL